MKKLLASLVFGLLASLSVYAQYPAQQPVYDIPTVILSDKDNTATSVHVSYKGRDFYLRPFIEGERCQQRFDALLITPLFVPSGTSFRPGPDFSISGGYSVASLWVVTIKRTPNGGLATISQEPVNIPTMPNVAAWVDPDSNMLTKPVYKDGNLVKPDKFTIYNDESGTYHSLY